MASSNGSDVQICLYKLWKLSSTTCVSLALKYPFHSLSLLCLFLLYMFFPLVFWVLVYSFPPLVCLSIILSVLLKRRKQHEEEAAKSDQGNCSEKRAMFLSDYNNHRRSFNRVHSVRQRRAKDIAKEDEKKKLNNHMQLLPNVVEENNEVISSANIINDILVDKNALREESPKEIREVEVEHGNNNTPLLNNRAGQESTFSSASQSLLKDDDHEFGLKSTFSRLKLDREEEGEEENSKDDETHKNMDTYQRNKRLESLIARRRSRKTMDLEVKMMKMDKSNTVPGRGQIASLIIPNKNNGYNSFLPTGNFPGAYSPGPDSAPSVLIPMRNPFDLPYDPQEEKPDLTGDHSFQQEFMSSSASNHNNRDIMFCRHESFSLGGSSNQNREGASPLVHDHFALRQRDSSKTENDREVTPITDQEPYEEVPQSTSTSDNPQDQIKEIIQVHENATDNQNHANHQGESQTRPDVSNLPASNSSSEDDEPIYNKIDKEAILKSLSSMARRNYYQEIEENNKNNNNDQIDDNLNYAWYADRTMRRHHPSYSIASDMQVELSEVSSPPLTIDENFCFQDDNYDQDISNWDSEPDLWGNSAGPSYDNHEMESRSALDNPTFPMHDSKGDGNASGEIAESSTASNQSRREINSIESQSTIRSAEDQPQSSTNQNQASITPSSNDPQAQLPLIPNENSEQQAPVVQNQSSYSSPKSVLHPTFSLDQLSSYDRDPDEELQQVSTQNTQVSNPHEVEHQNSTAPQVLQQVPSVPSSSSATEAANKQKIDGNETVNKQGEVASTSSQIHATREAEAPTNLLKPTTEETTSSSNNNDKVSGEKSSLPTDQKESSEPSSVSARKPVNEQKMHENETKTKEVASPQVPAELLKTAQETSSTSSINNDKDSSEKSSLSTNDKESSELSSMSTSGAVNNQKLHDNETKQGEVGSGSSQVMTNIEAPTKLLKPTDKTSTSFCNDKDKVSSEKSSLLTDQKEPSRPSSSTANEAVNTQKIVGKETKQGQVASGSSQIEGSGKALTELVKPIKEETSTSSPINKDKVSSEELSLSTDEKESSEHSSMSASQAVNKQEIHNTETKKGEVGAFNREAPTESLKPAEKTSTSTSSCDNNDKVSSEKLSSSTDHKQESSEPSNTLATGAVNNQHKIDGNETKQGEVSTGSAQKQANREAPTELLKPTEETSTSSINNDKISGEKSSLSNTDQKESSVDKQKIHENGIKPEEVSSSQVLASHEAPTKPTTETSNGSSNNVKVSSGNHSLTTNQKESSELSSTSTTENINKEKIHENGTKLGEVTRVPAELLKPMEETSASSSNNNDTTVSTKKPSLATDQEEVEKQQKKVVGEVTHNDGTKSSKGGDQTENSNLHKDTGHERSSDKPNDHETPIALPRQVEDKDKKNEHDKKGKEHGETK